MGFPVSHRGKSAGKEKHYPSRKRGPPGVGGGERNTKRGASDLFLPKETRKEEIKRRNAQPRLKIALAAVGV